MFFGGVPLPYMAYVWLINGGPDPNHLDQVLRAHPPSDFTQLGRETSSKDDQGTHLWEVFDSDCHGFVLDQDLIGLRSLPPPTKLT